jgi:uracil-DNA glycosylase
MDTLDADSLDREQLIALTRWFADMGVDCAISAQPHDRFGEAPPELARQPAEGGSQAAAQGRKPPLNYTSGAAAPSPQRPGAAAPPVPPDQAMQSAREAAAAAADLDALRAALDTFDGCTLKRSASQLVFADGNPNADIMIVGEAPGADEDRQGKPFAGRAGQLLDKMLAAIGLDRTTVYIANVVPWRPPGNRTPTPQETAICLPFIKRQIELVNPKVLVCAGAYSVQTLLGVKEGIIRARGKWHDYDAGNGDTIKAVAMLHPEFLLRTPARKRETWQDLLALKKVINQ